MSIGIVSLCPAAKIYLTISVIAMIVMSLNVFGTNHVFCIGSSTCESPINSVSLYLLKILYVVFWTWVLNVICRKVSMGLALAIALVPFLLFFVFLFGSYVLNIKSGFVTYEIIKNKTYKGGKTSQENAQGITFTSDGKASGNQSQSQQQQQQQQLVSENARVVKIEDLNQLGGVFKNITVQPPKIVPPVAENKKSEEELFAEKIAEKERYQEIRMANNTKINEESVYALQSYDFPPIDLEDTAAYE